MALFPSPTSFGETHVSDRVLSTTITFWIELVLFGSVFVVSSFVTLALITDVGPWSDRRLTIDHSNEGLDVGFTSESLIFGFSAFSVESSLWIGMYLQE